MHKKPKNTMALIGVFWIITSKLSGTAKRSLEGTKDILWLLNIAQQATIKYLWCPLERLVIKTTPAHKAWHRSSIYTKTQDLGTERYPPKKNYTTTNPDSKYPST